jgi:type IV secretory pathway VirB4 component
MPMNSVIEKPGKRSVAARVTLRSLHREVTELRQRISELEDLRELNQAIERNGSKPLVPWSKAKKELGLA